MSKYFYVKMAIIVLITLECSSLLAQNNWFPMHMGNFWQRIYRFDDYYYGECSFEMTRINTTDTITVNNKKYYQLYEEEELFWRYDKDDNILYSYVDSLEYVYMDFNLERGEYFFHRPQNSNYYREVRVIDGTYFVAGQTRYCKGFEYSYDDCDHCEFFAENIGPVLKWTSCSSSFWGTRRQTYTISANLFSDSAFVHHRANIDPFVKYLSVYSTQNSTQISDTVEIDAHGNVHCGQNVPRYFTFVREAIIEYFYSDGTDTTSIHYQSLSNFYGFNWALNLSLDPNYFYNGYDVYYRIKIFDKDFFPTTYYHPLGGAFKKISYSPTVSVENENIIEEFSLSQNFPNPFNSSTTFSFSLSRKAYINLEVYNSIGQCVSTLVSEYKPAGIYKIGFDASGLPSGIYFCRLNVMDGDKKLFSDVIKMTYLK